MAALGTTTGLAGGVSSRHWEPAGSCPPGTVLANSVAASLLTAFPLTFGETGQVSDPLLAFL